MLGGAPTFPTFRNVPARKAYTRSLEIKTGINRKRQLNLFDPDGTRIELALNSWRRDLGRRWRRLGGWWPQWGCPTRIAIPAGGVPRSMPRVPAKPLHRAPWSGCRQ